MTFDFVHSLATGHELLCTVTRKTRFSHITQGNKGWYDPWKFHEFSASTNFPRN